MGVKPRLITEAILGVAVRSVTSTVPASRSVLVVALTTAMARGMGLLDDYRRTGDHREGLGHPRLARLEVGLLRIRSGTLVHSLVRIIGVSDDWETAGVLLGEAGCSMVWR